MTDTQTQMETLAIAFLTGQATSDEQAEYKRLFETNASFREIVSEMGVWLAPLNENVEDHPVPDGLLGSIMAEIDTLGDGAKSSAAIAQTTPTQPANDRSSARWKSAAIAASLVAVVAVGSHFISPATTPTTDNQQLMALLSDNTKPQLMAIVYDPATGHVVARLSNITVPDDGDLQLWLIREGAKAPVSLGVMERAKTSSQIEFDIPESLRSDTDILAVSLEGLGGSKSAGPEGPVLFTGSVSELRKTL